MASIRLDQSRAFISPSLEAQMLLKPTNFFLLLIAVAFGLSLELLRAAQLGPGAPVTQSQPPAAQNFPVYALEGIVINAVTSRPIGNALVQISVLAEHRSLLTRPDGKFHFDNVPPGEFGMTVEKP